MLSLSILAILSPAALAQPEAAITVDPEQELGPVNRWVFGGNHVSYDVQHIFSVTSHDLYTNYGAGIWDPRERRPVPEALRLTIEMGMPVARFPGGCGAHSFDWKATIGPPEERPTWGFGLDEFIQLCEATESEPLITVSGYTGTPQDTADLVEYLNAPPDADHPWAQRRAANGHPEPYGVVWFEMGNETDHGNHEMKPFRKLTAAEYGAWVLECAVKMRAIDTGVKLTALMGTATSPDDPWNAEVLDLTGAVVDAIVVHTYSVVVWGEDPPASHDRLMRAAVVSPDQVEVLLAQYRELIRARCGRDIPLAITEYNAMFVQQQPVPYRYSLGAALFCADYLRVLLKPETNILMANYWQSINEYWGALRGPVRGEDAPYVKRPAYYVHQLYGNHFGDTLVQASADSPTFEAQGYGATHPARGDILRPKAKLIPGDLLNNVALQPGRGNGWSVSVDGLSLVFRLDDFEGSTYPIIAHLPHELEGGYRLSCEARAEGDLAECNLGVQIGDARGWLETQSATARDGLQSFADWAPASVDYAPLSDTTGLVLNLRCENKPANATGTLHLRNIKVERILSPIFPAAKMLTVSASASVEGRVLYLMVINKSLDQDVFTAIDLGGFPADSARAWTLSGPALHATNEDDPETCAVAERDVPVDQPFRVSFPARSMTALEVYRELE